MKPYDYAHRSGVRQISWEDFSALASRLAELVEPYRPQVILGIARAGLFPATFVACSLRLEFFPIRLTRRLHDQVLYEQPVWKVAVPQEIAGKRVAIIDEIADSGRTLALAAENARALGAELIISASLVCHSWANPVPLVYSLMTDEFVIFPWVKQVLVGGKWIPHPEIVAGLKAQRRDPPG